MRVVRVAVAIVLLSGWAEAQERRPLGVVDMIQLPSLSDPQLSPDGKQMLFTIDKADWKANRRVGHIYRINADGTGQVQLTFGERGESSPRWSPDGKSIAFTTRRDADANNQIYLLSVEGGEARRLTSHPTAPGSLTWAPDGKSIYFVAADAKSAEEKRTRSRVRRCVCVRGEQLQAASPLDDGSGGQDQARHRRRLERQRLRAERRRQAHRDAAHARARCSSSCDRTEVWVMDANGSNAKQLTNNKVPEGNAVALSGWIDRAVHVGRDRAGRHLLQRQAVPGPRGRRPGEDPAAGRRLRRRERVVEQGRQGHLLHREHGHAQRGHARERRDEGGRAAHQGRSQPRRLVVCGRRRAARVHAATASDRPSEIYTMAAGRAAQARDVGVRRGAARNSRPRARKRSRGRARTASRSRGC